MTVTQLYVFDLLYLIALVAVAILTRATWRRIVGALAGGLAGAPVALGIILLGERLGWWHMVISWEPHFVALMVISLALDAFVFLITWRIARRFGWRGLAVVLVTGAIIGPPRDQWYMRQFPEWGHYGPGLAPVFAISATYVILIALGHAVMRLVAGPADQDRLARRPWERA